ncbi:DUF2577 domain-containing protein [Paenibacillus sp. FSL H8-0537]|uniref:DUF2577 domain-containing protein n=1 Tax=Paenibacillus sp. FSL H8-0537 TaxID=2921399 RepID=UPI003101702F
MMALLDAIKKAGAAAHASGNPVAVLIGRVTGTNPLEVNVDQRFTLSEDFLIIPEGVSDVQRISRALEPGDIVVLLRVQGGQQFVVLDRVSA